MNDKENSQKTKEDGYDFITEAFPANESISGILYYGMPLIDWFAGQALASNPDPDDNLSHYSLSDYCYKQAASMMKLRLSIMEEQRIVNIEKQKSQETES